MPADVKPLFRPDALRPKLAEFTIPLAAMTARPKLAEWVKLLASDAGKKRKETELLADFLRDVFVDLLRYFPILHNQISALAGVLTLQGISDQRTAINCRLCTPWLR